MEINTRLKKYGIFDGFYTNAKKLNTTLRTTRISKIQQAGRNLAGKWQVGEEKIQDIVLKNIQTDLQYTQ